MQQYHDLLNHILKNWITKSDRTWTWTTSVFWYQMRFDLSQWFPLLTTKKVFTKWILHELLWFLQWSTNIQYLCKHGVGIWNARPFQNRLKQTWQEQEFEMYSDEWKHKMNEFVESIKNDDIFASKRWELGPVYGKQRRDFGWVDQIKQVIQTIQTNPDSRRMIVSAWNVPEVELMAKAGLPPCHTLFQFYVADGKLSCQLYQRSADVFLWVPFNIASYALLVHMIAHVTDLEVGDFVHTFGDAHIYSNHMQQVHTQLQRKFKTLPTLSLNPAIKDIFDFTYEDITIHDYFPHPSIKAPVAV